MMIAKVVQDRSDMPFGPSFNFNANTITTETIDFPEFVNVSHDLSREELKSSGCTNANQLPGASNVVDEGDDLPHNEEEMNSTNNTNANKSRNLSINSKQKTEKLINE